MSEPNITKTFVTSDQHFCHHNIIKYCNRPFQTYWEMDNEIVRRHNIRVSPDDRLIIVGDFGLCSNRTIKRHTDILGRLNGSPKILVLGNHDGSKKRMLEIGFDEVHKSLQLGDVFFVHNPADLQKQRYIDGLVLITGHRHNDAPKFYTKYGYKIINISVDVWDFYPVGLEELRSSYRSEEFPKHVDTPSTRRKKYDL